MEVGQFQRPLRNGSTGKLVMHYLLGRSLLSLTCSPIRFCVAPPRFIFLFLCFRALRASTHHLPLFTPYDDAFTGGLHCPGARIPHEVECFRLTTANRAIRLGLTQTLVFRRGRLARETLMRLVWRRSLWGGGTNWSDNRGRNRQVNGWRSLRLLIRGRILDVSGFNGWRRRVNNDRSTR